MTVPTVLFSIETWVLKQKHCISLTAAEMYCLRSVRGCTRQSTFALKILDKN